MLTKDAIVYAVLLIMTYVGFDPAPYGCAAVNAVTEADAKASLPPLRPVKQSAAMADDDGDAFSKFDFYYDEYSWDNETSDRY